MAKPTSIDEYIAAAPAEHRERLSQLRECIAKAAPGATQNLKWGMPAFSYNRILVTFAIFKNHIGFYPTPTTLAAFQKILTSYKTGNGSIQFPHEKALPLPLVKKMVSYRINELKQMDAKWKA